MQAEHPVNPRCPSICFSEEEIQSFHKPWSRALVVKVLERSFAFPTIKRRLENLWAKHGQIQVTDASNAFFIVRFSDPADYHLAAFRGPWKIYDYYITVARWSPDFDETALISKILTWVRLPKLPIHYFNNVAVSRIGDYIGRTVRLDLATEEGARGRFARVCVEIDLSKPLLGKYMIKDRLFYIEYESLDNICTQCGLYGHKIDKCPELLTEPISTPPLTEDNMETTTEEGDFGDWMTVTHRKHGRRNKQDAPPPRSKPIADFRPRLLRRGEAATDISSTQEEGLETLPSQSSTAPVTDGPLKVPQRTPVSSSHTNSKPSAHDSYTVSPNPPVTNLAAATTKSDTSPITTDKSGTDLVSVPITYTNPVFQSSPSPNVDCEGSQGRQILVKKKSNIRGKHHSGPSPTVPAKLGSTSKAPTSKAKSDHASVRGRPPEL
ncbi:hypothetical protein LINGRAHAP2_LOCUS13898 [Linum grandiflorum]